MVVDISKTGAGNVEPHFILSRKNALGMSLVAISFSLN